MTGVSLSEITGVSSKMISTYENGHSSPSSEVLHVLSEGLNVPSSFFLLGNRAYERGTVFNRSISAPTKAARERSDLRMTWLRDIVNYLSGFVSFPEANFPDLGLSPDPALITEDEIEVVAGALRNHWHMRTGPIANMVLLLENQGAIVARDALGSQAMESKSEIAPDEQRPYVFIGTDKGTPVRWRFDAAHELGHLILHSHLDQKTFSNPNNHKMIEGQAHRFAGAFLLPAAEFGDDLYAATLDGFRSLKLKWKTSIGMMIMRASDLGFISEATHKNLQISYSRRGWRRLEPEDDTMEIEEPRMLRRAFEMILSEGIQTPADVLDALRLEARDVEALAGLAPGHLSSFSPVTLFPAQPAAPEPGDPNEGAVILHLPFGRGGP